MYPVHLLTDTGIIPLNGGAVGLREWPTFFDGFEQSHAWDHESGVFRETVPTGPQQGEMNLVVKGRGVKRAVSDVLSALRWGEDGFEIQVTSHGGARRLPVRLLETGQVQWYPEPTHANLAAVPLRVEWATPVWLGETVTRKVTGVSGQVDIPYGGDIPAWPVLNSAGSNTIRLRESDEVLALNGTFKIFTDPNERGVFTPDGKPHVSTVVPFWASPPRLVPGGMRMFLNVPSNASLTVTVTEKWSRAWL